MPYCLTFAGAYEDYPFGDETTIHALARERARFA
jgi:hypothetical protein